MSQIKSKKRVSDYGEVYTAQAQVTAMLDLIPELRIETTYLEPACGNGNFLAEILKRKLRLAVSQSEDNRILALNMLRAVSSVYGVDIQRDNVSEAIIRLISIVSDVYKAETYSILNKPLISAVQNVLFRNIQCGNILTGLTEQDTPLIICEWNVRNSGYITCREYVYTTIVESGGSCDRHIRKHRYDWLVAKKTQRAA